MFLILPKPNLSNLRSNRLFIAIFVIGLVLSSAYFISAQETRPDRSNLQGQERGQRGERGRGQFDPAQMAERQTQRAIEGLNLSDGEAAVLVPRNQSRCTAPPATAPSTASIYRSLAHSG